MSAPPSSLPLGFNFTKLVSSACLVIVKYDIACCFSKPQNSTRKEALPYIFKVFLVKRALDVKEEERVFFSHVSA